MDRIALAMVLSDGGRVVVTRRDEELVGGRSVNVRMQATRTAGEEKTTATALAVES